MYRNTETADEIREVFERCTRRQQQLNPSTYQKLKKAIISTLAFSRLQFPRAPDLPTDSEALLIWQGHLYQALLVLLKTEDPDEYWSVLAQWQKYEGLRAPEQFLPSDVWRRLTRDASARLSGFPGKMLYHAELVKIPTLSLSYENENGFGRGVRRPQTRYCNAWGTIPPWWNSSSQRVGTQRWSLPVTG